MRVHVLGSAAGGGFPQWNCGCGNCRGVREGTIAAVPRTQTSLAIEAADGGWVMVHASPDVRTQVTSLRALHPRAVRDSPITGILLTNGDLDQCLGLLSLREGQPLHVYATDAVRRGLLEGNRLFRALDRHLGHLTWHELKLEVPHELPAGGAGPSLIVTAVPIPGKVPLYLEGLTNPEPDTNVALLFRESERGPTLGVAPCVGGPSPSVERLLRETDCVLFDGTFWSDDELQTLGIGRRTARDMAHWPIGGPNGSLRVLAKARASRRILIHINNTNPLLQDHAPERREAERAGVEIAYDGMEIVLP